MCRLPLSEKNGNTRLLSKLKCLIASCIFLSNFSYATQNDLNIAVISPFSGHYAAYGTILLSGAIQAADDINSNGGVKGINLQIIPIDDQCDPKIAQSQAQKLIKEKKIHAIIGHVCSSCAMQTLEAYAKAKILVITPTATNVQITQQNIPTIFRMTGTDDQQAQVASNFLLQELKSSRIAILHDNEMYSKGLAELVSEDLVLANTYPIMHMSIERGTKNFKPVVKKLRELNADAVYFASLYPEVGELAKTLNVMQLQIPIISGDGVSLNQFITEAGGSKIAQSVLMTFVTDPNKLATSKEVVTKMQQKNMETNGYSLYAYAAVQAIAAAIAESNTTEGRALAHWLHQHEVDTVLGRKSWNTNGDIIDANFKIYVWTEDNQLRTIS